MIVQLDEVKIIIVFTKEHTEHKNGSAKINTSCHIYVLQIDESWEPWLWGKANQNYKDKYNKITGKRIALTRAMDAAQDYFGVINTKTKVERNEKYKARRTKVWAAFNKEVRGVG